MTNALRPADFRLHTMDLHQPAVAASQHWMAQDATVRFWLERLEPDYQELINVGGDPFGGRPMSLDSIITRLGFADLKQPEGLLATAKFCAGMYAAATRECAWITREVLRLHRKRLFA